MYVYYGTLHLVGCTFLENSALLTATHVGEDSAEDIYIYGSSVSIYGCPAGFSGATGAALDTSAYGAITGEAKSYSCGACVR